MGALVGNRHALERRRSGRARRAIAEHVERLVDERPLAIHGEADGDGRGGLRRVRVTAEHDARAGQVGAASLAQTRLPVLAQRSSITSGCGAMSLAEPSCIMPKVALTTTVMWSVPPLRHSVVPLDTGLSDTMGMESDPRHGAHVTALRCPVGWPRGRARGSPLSPLDAQQRGEAGRARRRARVSRRSLSISITRASPGRTSGRARRAWSPARR